MWSVGYVTRLIVWVGSAWSYLPSAGTSSLMTQAFQANLYKARPGGQPCVNCNKSTHVAHMDLERTIQLEKIKKNILSAMRKLDVDVGSHHRQIAQPINPQITTEESAKEEIIDSNLVSDIISKSQPPDGIKDKNVIQFDLKNETLIDNVGVHEAMLYVFLKKRGKKVKANKRITLRISTVDDRGKPKKLLSSLKMRMTKSTWGKLGLPADLLRDALNNSSTPLKLHVRCKKCRRVAKPIMVLKSPKRTRRYRKGKALKTRRKQNLNRNRPVIVIRRKVLPSRSKRHVTGCSRRNTQHNHPHNTTQVSQSNTCCKTSYYLNFTTIGWGDWIISPEGTIVSFCEGRCQNRRSSSFMDTVTRQSPARGRRQRNRKCQPTRSSPLVIVYFDQSLHVVQKRIRDITVESCGCRSTN